MDDYQLKLTKFINNNQIMDSETFENLVEYLGQNIVSSQMLDLVLRYFEYYPQQISCIPKRLIIHLLSNPKENLHPLVIFLILRHDINYDLDLDHLPIEKLAYVMSAFYQRIPLMIYDPALVINIKNKMDTYKMLIESPKWFSENEDFFVGLHAIGFDENECEELLTKLKTKWLILKISKSAVSFIDLVASKCNREIEFNQYLIQVLFSLLPEMEDITWLTNRIISNLKLLEGTKCPIQFSDWNALAKKAIQYGLKDINPEFGFIRVFKSLIKKADVDACILKEIFEILAGYSHFTSIMLKRDSNHVQKEIVLKLVETLVKKEPSIMLLSHVPLYLCSYNASLSTTDQILLRILFHYEENSIPVSNYRPYLWGSFAASHYQVKNHLISNSLNNIPSTTEVLSYVPLNRIKATLSMFPFERMLHIQNQKITCYKTKKYLDPSQMFDPAFLLPMISSLLATEAPLSVEKFNRSGCLSMVLACLSSSDNAMRSAAYHVLTLLRNHLFCRRAENLFWDHFINWVSGGIQILKTKSDPPQLSMIQALFLGRVVLAIANHEKCIDVTCSKILTSRPTAQFNHIPGLKTFLAAISGPKDKQLHMRWFFEIIRDGLRSSCDWQVLKELDLLNISLVMFKSGGSKDRILILNIMKSAFMIEPATNGGTGHWAIGLMVTISKCIDFNSLSTEEIMLAFECLQMLSKSSFIRNYAIDFWLLMFLEYGKSPDICLEGFVTLKNLVSKYKNVHEFINEDNIKEILSFGKITKVLSDFEVFQCQSILEHGSSGIKVEETNSYIFLPTMIQILNTTNV